MFLLEVYFHGFTIITTQDIQQLISVSGECSTSSVLLLMFVGGCAGSTAGGIKVSRVVIYVKNSLLKLRKWDNLVE